MLALERKLESKDYWFILLTFVVRFSVVDMHALNGHVKSNSDENEHKK